MTPERIRSDASSTAKRYNCQRPYLVLHFYVSTQLLYLCIDFPPCADGKFKKFCICLSGAVSPSLMLIGIYGNLEKNFAFGTAENVLT